jgi:Domain of unknown function (DUF4787)
MAANPNSLHLARRFPKKEEASNAWLVFVVKILLILVILLWLLPLVESATSNQKMKKQRRRAEVVLAETRLICEHGTCGQWIPEESMNCVQLCLSPACYQQVYVDMPLEDGEIDVDRAKIFEKCVKEEMRLARKRQRNNPQLY